MALGLLFPGQSSQFSGMGKGLAENYPLADAIFREADEVLGYQLTRLMFEGPEEKLVLTPNAQPAILTLSYTLFRLLDLGSSPITGAAGHSLGEYTALVAAGALSFPEALRAVHYRGNLMQEAVPPGIGAMAAIMGIEAEAVEACCQAVEGSVVAANYNSPIQTIISGESAAVQEAAERCKAAGARQVVPLSVSAPFHSPLMEPVREPFRAFLETLEFQDAAFPVAVNVTGKATTKAGELREALVEQIARPVYWVRCVETLKNLGALTFIEIGPKRVLAGLMKRIDRATECLPCEDAETLEAAKGRIRSI